MVVSPKRLFFQMSPITVAEWEIVFSDDIDGVMSLLATSCRLPSRSKDVEIFRGGNISQKVTTVTHTANLSITFLLEQTSAALDWLDNWYNNGGRKNIDVYMIKQMNIVNIAALSPTIRLRKFKLYGTQIIGLPGIPFNNQMAEIIRQDAEFTVDSMEYGSKNI